LAWSSRLEACETNPPEMSHSVATHRGRAPPWTRCPSRNRCPRRRAGGRRHLRWFGTSASLHLWVPCRSNPAHAVAWSATAARRSAILGGKRPVGFGHRSPWLRAGPSERTRARPQAAPERRLYAGFVALCPPGRTADDITTVFWVHKGQPW